jgi:hypothetical protein
MIKNFMTLSALSRSKKPENDPRREGCGLKLGEAMVMTIFG